MQLTTTASTLLAAITRISGAIKTSTVLPITECILFTPDTKTLGQCPITLTTTDMEVTLSTTFTPSEIEEPEAVAIPSKLLTEVLKALPESAQVKLETDTTKLSAALLCGTGKYKFALEDANNFPKVKLDAGANGAPKVVLEYNECFLRHALEHTLFATTTDDLRPAMCGIYISQIEDNGRYTFCATDAHRLAYYGYEANSRAAEGSGFIIPKKAATLLKGWLSSNLGSNITIIIERAGNHLIIKGLENIEFTTRLIDERYPDVKAVMDSAVLTAENTYSVGRYDLIQAIKRVLTFSVKGVSSIRFDFIGNKLTLSAEDAMYGKAASDVIAVTPGEFASNITIGFNGRYMLDILNALDADNVTIAMDTPQRAGIINDMMLLMPVQLEGVA